MEIKKVILGAFGYVYVYRVAFAKSLVIPFILFLIVISLVPYVWLDSSSSFGLALLSMMIYVVFAITTHRIIIIGPTAVPKWGFYKLTKRELSFVLHIIGIGLIMVPITLFQLIPFFGSILTTVLLSYIFSRLSLVFPAIATDDPMSFKESWNATRNHQLLMLIIVIIFPLGLSIPETILMNIPHTRILVNILSVVTYIFGVAALSVAFQVIKEKSK